MRAWLRTLSLEAKSAVRVVLGLPDPWKRFRRFEAAIHPDTWAGQRAVLAETAEAAPAVDPEPGPLADALAFRAEVLESFRGRWAPSAGDWKVLIHLPRFGTNPAGHSLFRNLGMGLDWVGVPVMYWDAGTPLGPYLSEFGPTLLLSIDHVVYQLFREQPDVAADLRGYRQSRRLVLGLASNYGLTGGPGLGDRLAVARRLGVGFFFAFQCPEFVADRYRPVSDAGFPVLSLEFAANPLVYRPLPGVRRTLGYVFLGSSNAEKWGRYFEYLSRPWADHPGLIVGPGWSAAAAVSVSDEQANRLYARAKVGLNLHVPFQIAEPTELNERAYNLAAAAVPQLTDRPALLPARFTEQAVFVADTADRYAELFEHLLANPDEAERRGLQSMREVLAGHTIFHRADALLRFVRERWAEPTTQGVT